jgi:hypothetical protein
MNLLLCFQPFRETLLTLKALDGIFGIPDNLFITYFFLFTMAHNTHCIKQNKMEIFNCEFGLDEVFRRLTELG